MNVRSGGVCWTVVAQADIRLSTSGRKATGSIGRSGHGTRLKCTERQLTKGTPDLPRGKRAYCFDRMRIFLSLMDLPLLPPHTPHVRADVDPNLSCVGGTSGRLRRSDGP